MMRKYFPVGMALVLGLNSMSQVLAQTETEQVSRPSLSERFSRWKNKLIGAPAQPAQTEQPVQPMAQPVQPAAQPAGATPVAYPQVYRDPQTGQLMQMPAPQGTNQYQPSPVPGNPQPNMNGQPVAKRGPVPSAPSTLSGNPNGTQTNSYQFPPLNPAYAPATRVGTPPAGNPFAGRQADTGVQVSDFSATTPAVTVPSHRIPAAPVTPPAANMPKDNQPPNFAKGGVYIGPETKVEAAAHSQTTVPGVGSPVRTANQAEPKSAVVAASQNSEIPATEVPESKAASANLGMSMEGSSVQAGAQASTQSAVPSGAPEVPVSPLGGHPVVSGGASMRSKFRNHTVQDDPAPVVSPDQLKSEYPTTDAPPVRTASTVKSEPEAKPERKPEPKPEPKPQTVAAPVKPEPKPEPKPEAVVVAQAPVYQPSESVLQSGQSPILVVETSGPRSITIGKEAEYKVTLRNYATVVARDVVVLVKVPHWADVTTVEAKSAATHAANHTDGVKWTLKQLGGKGSEELVLKLIPRQGQPFDLSVSVTHSPVASLASVDVKEPKLNMTISGPREVLYGKQEVYKLVLSNPGTGDAEEVELKLLPTVPGETASAAHKLGLLKAGEEKVIELELTARQTGLLRISAEVAASGGLKANVDESVLVLKASLQASVHGPRLRYAGTTGTYELRVSNPGNAAAKGVKVAAQIPAGVRFLAANQSGKYDHGQRQVVWTIDDLPAGKERVMTCQLELDEQGEAKIDVVCTADLNLKEACQYVTHVESVADLMLSVSDPRGPLPVGEEMIYEVTLLNRGTKAAEQIDLTAIFSDNMEAIGADTDVKYEVSSGKMTFASIGSLAPGQRKIIRVKAKALAGGNHHFRAELSCKSLDTRIAKEESTLFYGESPVEATAEAPSGTTRR